MREQSSAVVMLSGRKFFFSCAMVAAIILFIGRIVPLSISLLALEVFATILGLFFFGSFRYQIHKNAVTYGMVLIIIATFCGLSSSQWHVEIAQRGWERWAQDNLFSFHGLDELIHAIDGADDTMIGAEGDTDEGLSALQAYYDRLCDEQAMVKAKLARALRPAAIA